jgi:hypothetical protein
MKKDCSRTPILGDEEMGEDGATPDPLRFHEGTHDVHVLPCCHHPA